jgi:redox-sensitive bicupin YhaK (pirin superfamily)
LEDRLILSERSSDIGGFTVGRLLPFRQKRMIGPFIFIDHMGPARVGPPGHFDIGQHPHIGLSTLTYLLEGEIFHKDSLGSEKVITPGDVNWMTAGKGIVHTEKTPDHHTGKEFTIHGY